MIRTIPAQAALTQSRLEKAIKREQPVTLSYLEEEKDQETGKRTGRKDEDGNKILVETVRTIEPTEIRETKAGDLIIRAIDRKDGKVKSWRLDRIAAYTIHRTRFIIQKQEKTAPAPVVQTSCDGSGRRGSCNILEHWDWKNGSWVHLTTWSTFSRNSTVPQMADAN